MCSRCVRFTREISGTAELQVINRGDHSEIDIFPGEPLNNKLAGNVVDLCPVGALCSKDFLYKQRVWFLQAQNERLPRLQHRLQHPRRSQQGHRLPPAAAREPAGPGLLHVRRGPLRLPLRQLARAAQAAAGPPRRRARRRCLVTTMCCRALRRDAERRGRAATARPSSAVLSPFLTCEEAYLLATLSQGAVAEVRLALGPVPVVGEDDTYPKDRKGQPVEPVKFTIRAEKCPNRRGVEEVLRHFQGEVIAVRRGAREPPARASSRRST